VCGEIKSPPLGYLAVGHPLYYEADYCRGVGSELPALAGLWWQAAGQTLLASGQRHVASLVRDPYTDTPRMASRITLMTKSGCESIGTWLLSMS
jgi:hypothetical protein